MVPAVAETDSGAMPIRILLVDDSQEFLSSAVDFLSRDSRVQIVGQAANGLQGCELAMELEPDLVLMDFSMPVMDGSKATHEMKAQGSRSKIVLCTIGTAEEVRRKAEHAGVDGVIQKSDFAQDILSIIESFRVNRNDRETSR